MAIARLVIRRGEKEANRSASCAFTVGIGDACIRVLIELMIDHARQVKHVLYFYYYLRILMHDVVNFLSNV